MQDNDEIQSTKRFIRRRVILRKVEHGFVFVMTIGLMIAWILWMTEWFFSR